MLAQGAVVTSFGLALATWMRRVGRAIAASVASYAVLTFCWFLLLEMEVVSGTLSWFGLFKPDDLDADRFFTMIAASLCPLAAQITPLQSLLWADALSRYAFYIGHVIVLLLTIGVAFLFLGLTLATFNRSMGRMPERRRRAPRPPRQLRAARGRTRLQPVRQRLFWPGSTLEMGNGHARSALERPVRRSRRIRTRSAQRLRGSRWIRLGMNDDDAMRAGLGKRVRNQVIKSGFSHLFRLAVCLFCDSEQSKEKAADQGNGDLREEKHDRRG